MEQHMDGAPRITLNLLKILRVLLEDPMTERYGLELGKAARLSGGSLYPLLMRLEQAGMVVSDWEDADPSQAGRPRRRFYRLTTEGAEFARRVVQEAQEAITPDLDRKSGWGRTPAFPVPGGASV
jgi:DNA-binding PadR family transcriptional regulator